MTVPPVIVGIDGGPASVQTLQAAQREAALRGTEVRAVICWPTPTRKNHDRPDGFRTAAEASAMFEHVVAAAGPSPVSVIPHLALCDAGPELTSASNEASLLVLGSTTHRWTARRHGHAVIDYCLRYARIPVLVVPWLPTELDGLDLEHDLAEA